MLSAWTIAAALTLTGTAPLTGAAQWLMDVFFSLDKAILAWYHGLAEAAGGVLTPIADLISFTGWKGLALIVAALVLLCFKKTRRTGICACIALAVGYVLVNLLIKPIVARPRPYDIHDAEINAWRAFIDNLSFSPGEGDKSFPSGHMNAACAFAGAVVFSRGKKWFPWMLLYVVLMGMSRNYLIVHYPSDVLFAFITGTCAALAAALITGAIYKRWGESKLLKDTH